MIQLALVGGTAIYHGFAFAALINGLSAGESFPAGWPPYPQQVENARITVVWDEDRAAAQKLAQVFGIEHVAENFEDVVAHCDGIIIADDGTLNHCRHAPFFLERGIPTFIDKPLAPDAATAQRLVDLAERHGAPLMSGSALRYAAETEALRADSSGLGRVELTIAVGPSDLYYYGIHALEAAYSILGGGIESVQNIGDERQDIVKVAYRDGRVLLLLVSRVAGYGFEVSLYSAAGRHHIKTFDDAAYYSNQLRAVVDMIRHRKAPVAITEALEILRVLEAGKQSLREGGKLILV